MTARDQAPAGPRKAGLALKLSALLVLLIIAEMLAVNSLIQRVEPMNETAILFLFVLFAFFTGLLFAAALDFLVTRPLLHMLHSVRELPARAYATPLLPRGLDEPRELCEAIEAMRRTVLSQQEELRRWTAELEQRVDARTRELRLAQAQLVHAEKLASIGELAGGIAHEVNNPTGVILARASFLCSVADEENLDPEIIEDIEMIVHQAQRIKGVTGDLLSFARHSDRGQEGVDLVEVCHLVRKLLAHQARKAEVDVHGDLPARLVLHGSRNGLEQIVFNLLKNAIEATPPGGRVTLALRPGEPGASKDGDLVLLVDDTGPGVPEEIRSRIFDPFFTTKPRGKGTGLGLSVVYGLVTEHGGTIAVEDAPEGGARFRVTLPSAPEPPPDEPASANPTESP
jgi:two-component system NtrC family sensor kinase